MTFLRQSHRSTYPDQSYWNWTGIPVSKKTLGSVLLRLPCCALMLNTRPPAHCGTSDQPGQSGLPVGRMRRHRPIREAFSLHSFSQTQEISTLSRSLLTFPFPILLRQIHYILNDQTPSPLQINLIYYFWGILYKVCSMYLFCNLSEIQM